MPVFKALLDQLMRQHPTVVGPPTTEQQGYDKLDTATVAAHPAALATQSWRDLERGARVAGYFGKHLDPAKMMAAQDLGSRPDEMVTQYLYGVKSGAADDVLQKRGEPRRFNPAFEMYPEPPTVGVQPVPPGKIMLKSGAVPTENDSSMLYDAEINKPYMLVPASGAHDDDQVLARRAQGKPAYQPSDFAGLSAQQAAAAIANQLKARRIRQMGYAAPDYLDTLPKI